MTTLANFVTEFGFRSDGSFERAMQAMQRRLSTLGSSLEASASRSTRALTNRNALTQHSSHVELMQRRQLRMDSAHTRAIIENRRRQQQAQTRMHSEALRENNARDRAERQRISRQATAERQQMAERLRSQRNAERVTRNADRELERWRNQQQRNAGGSGGGGNRLLPHGGGGGSNPFAPLGGVPLMGRTTVGQMAGGFGIAELVRQSYQAAQFEARTMPTLEFITKNRENALVEKAFIDKQVKDLSLEKVGTTKAYTDFAASAYSSLGSKGTQDLFEGAQSIGIMTGRTPAEMHLAMKAFGQIKIAV